MFHIVDFISVEKKETEVVPSSWVQDGMSYWPPYTSTGRCTRAVKRQEAPDETWDLFDVNIRFARAILREILTSIEMIKQKQKLILPQLQKLQYYIHYICVFVFQTMYLRLSGGMTTKGNVWRILSKLLTNVLAMKMNWRGANGKQAFEPLALKSVVIGPVRRSHSEVPDVEIEKYVKRWMQLAPDRDGGRKRRPDQTLEE
ncbi:uncharacterized protein LOC115149627 [Salmo trutta]|uniref:uncharacterized protein LOC115149627 n=1 Tax=Salmo trutta TaxID=8032 RepID=UPI001130398D|nr:uncharacterized protein LOC115149627 [Salmo trutta]